MISSSTVSSSGFVFRFTNGGDKMPRFYDEFPYTNTGDINLDWLLTIVKELDERVTVLEERVNELENGGDTP